MGAEIPNSREQILISLGLVTLSLLYGIPWIDIDNSVNVARSLAGAPIACGEESSEQAEAIVLLSAGNDRVNNTEPNYHEKRRIDAVVYEYLRLLENGTPPRVIVLALDDGIEKTYKVRNHIQTIVTKLSPGTEVPNDIFRTVYAEHTDSSLLEAKEVLDSLGIDGPVTVVTSQPHVNRAHYNSCRRHINGRTLAADDLIEMHDQDTFQQMQ